MTKDTQDKKNYKSTLNLPQTQFPMKANLVQQEPAAIKRWQEAGLYKQVRDARAGAPKFSFHDGPPYANGSIHLGHLLNKALKDFVVRSRTMEGKDCPYIPGWDCHGLPIEHKVVQELGEKARTMEPFQIRRRCQTYAEKFVKLQSGQMQRLLTLADYDNPYLTMDPAYEAGSLEVFAKLVAQGLVYRALKPVHWSLANQTALAEAELEYEDRKDTSVYVLFELEPGTLAIPPAAASALGGAPAHLMIWTTTPWTLPANLAVAAHERYTYGLYRIDHGGRSVGVILATDLAGKVLAMTSDAAASGGGKSPEPLATWTGAQLTAARYTHPFIDRTSPVVTADYVTLEDGTGLVHTAPGHGVEDYQTGLREKIQFSADRKRVLTRSSPGAADKADTYCPVLGDGRFDETSPDFLRDPSIDVWKANGLVIEKLRASGHLFHDHVFTHSYPHDWRSKTPVIFRATEQWFVGVDLALADDSFKTGSGSEAVKTVGPANGTLRQRAIAGAEFVKFYPDWGQNRLKGMLESRPDWCISRQRAWGLPIPAFFAPNGRDVLLTVASVRAVADVIRKHGSDHWFKAGAAELLAGYDPASDPDAPAWLRLDAKALDAKPGERFADFKKSTDIFDVWFDSGTSWNSVIRQRLGDDWFPTDLYLEGSDQHRGWFQASLLPALGTTGKPPYKAVLTHGFMVDKDGRKMSKSLGNALEVETLLKDHGADVCRWWVSSINTDNDIKV
ncbi:MAG: isoleucine--tRNA ligase, partial [Planctomycetota bacterium]|nr:isoleucine--tRNA ligase [Planctomycetota bacterium]